MTTTRAQRTIALVRWTDNVKTADLVEANTGVLREIAELVEERAVVDTALLDAVSFRSSG